MYRSKGDLRAYLKVKLIFTLKYFIMVKCLQSCFVALLMLLTQVTWAQERAVSGTVTASEDGSALPGVNVVIQGTSNGTITDIDGKFKLNVTSNDAILVFSYIGFQRTEVEVGNRSVVDVALESDVTELSEVVVTAIGIEKEAKSLGYAVGVVDSEDLVRARDPNLVNSLAGKVAGVQITNTSGTIGGGSRIVVRGQASIGDGANNQPLFVVDGVPIYNTNFASGTDGADGNSRINGNVNTGNAAGDINPDDIASISVLKGGAAAALYGQRAKDGVIIITTKKGNRFKGPQVQVNSSVRLDQPFVLPEFQNEYAQGDFGKYLLDSRGRPQSLNGWGPRIAGQEVVDFRGETVNLQAYPDNVKDFYQTGVTSINSVSFSDATEKDDFRLSLSNTYQTGIIPESDLVRYNVGINTGRNISDKFKARISANYVNTATDNIAVQGSNNVNVLSTIINTLPRTVNVEDVKTFIDPATGFQVPLNENTNNPYWILNRNTVDLNRERIFGNLEFNYELFPGLNITARQGIDYLVSDLERLTYPGTIGITTNGQIVTQQRKQTQLNTDIFANFNKDIGVFNLNVIAGYNFNQLGTEILQNLASDLKVDNVITYGNANANALTRDNAFRRLLGAYADLTLGYKDYLFLNLTARNDWSSTLPKDNNSYFYPSANLSFVFTDAFNLNSGILSYGKLRASAASVGSDANPYLLDFRAFPVTNFFGQLGTSNQFPFGGLSGFEVTGTIPNVNLEPQQQVTYEVGGEFQFIDGRIGVDVNFYNAETRGQILNLLIPASTGFRRQLTNAGTIRNRGVELLLTGVPVKTADFSWTISANFTQNRNEVIELAEGVEEIRLESGFNDGVLIARPNEGIHFFGNGYERDGDGNIVINENTGLREESNNIDLGEVQPDWLMGITNSFSYKGFDFSFLFDIRQGGLIVSNTVGLLRRNGMAAETAFNREGTFIDQGVIVLARDDEGNITETRPNDVPVRSMQEWWENAYSSRNAEAVAFDASFVKLREIRFGYSLPSSILSKTPFERVNLAFEARNLLLLHSKVPDIDPETQTTGPADNFAGYEFNNVPTTRSLGFNLGLTF